MKLIDFSLSDFIRPDERLNDIVGRAYYVAPEVLDISYSVEADIWSIGDITYILLCGSRPFWARTESGIFRAVLRADQTLRTCLGGLALCLTACQGLCKTTSEQGLLEKNDCFSSFELLICCLSYLYDNLFATFVALLQKQGGVMKGASKSAPVNEVHPLLGGGGKTKVWLIDGSAKTPVASEYTRKFYNGDCYSVLYTYRSHERKDDYYIEGVD